MNISASSSLVSKIFHLLYYFNKYLSKYHVFNIRYIDKKNKPVSYVFLKLILSYLLCLRICILVPNKHGFGDIYIPKYMRISKLLSLVKPFLLYKIENDDNIYP